VASSWFFSLRNYKDDARFHKHKTVSKFATGLCRFVSVYNFRLNRLKKSTRSCADKVRCFCNLKFTNSANIHNTARWRCVGQSWKSGRISNALWMFHGVVLNILAILLDAHCHVLVPSPHSTRRCSKVSLFPQSVQMSLLVMLKRFMRVFVGIMSCIALYQVTRSDFCTGVAFRFLHTFFQFVCGHILVIRISCIVLAALLIFCRVAYTPFLYVLIGSMALGFRMYAASSMYSRMYPSVAGT